jgi:hypothetical protein
MTETRPSKLELIESISEMLGVRNVPRLSTGSTEPREIFEVVNETLGLGLDPKVMTKPEIARGIVEAAGLPWQPNFESRGGTVTREGLIAVCQSVRFFLGVRES